MQHEHERRPRRPCRQRLEPAGRNVELDRLDHGRSLRENNRRVGKRVDPAESTELAKPVREWVTPPTKRDRANEGDDGELTPLARPSMGDDDELDRAVAKAKAEAALFGESEAVKIGRYHLIERVGAGGMGVVWKAFDPDLNRGIALKLASAGDLEARRRARDEGRALAKLSHPNVVPIYDVIEHESGVFLVMELVKGQTLRQLAAEATPLQLVRAYRQAGAGLAAAHEVGLVHRDFKPDNAIMGADERVRVLDFGLAHEVSIEQREIAGTPRYMAPEQRAGDALTPAADQYAFCVALREGLASKGQVPRWLQPILARGASEKPADRFPSMQALLGELALDPATRWRRRGVIALGVAAVGVGVGAFTIGRAQQEESPCEGGPGLVAPSWGADRRAAITKHLGSLTTPYAVEAAPRITQSLDTYTTDWVRIYKSSCQAHRRGEISAALLDRRSGCLSRRRAALGAITTLAAAVPGEELPDLVVAVADLPDVAACDDDDALMADVEPPPPAKAAQASTIADEIAQIDVERDAGKLEDAARRAEEVVSRADALGYRPLRARARLARGRIKLTGLTDDRGEKDFREATHDALAVGDAPMSVEAYARLAYAVGTQNDPSGATNATDGLTLIESLAESAADRARFGVALLHHNLGSVLLARGNREEARKEMARSREVAMGVKGSGEIELTIAFRGSMLTSDDEADRQRFGNELIAARTRLLGARHPLTLDARIVTAAMVVDPERSRAQLLEPCEEMARFHPDMGGFIAECGLELSWLAYAAGDKPAATAAADLVASVAERGADVPLLRLAAAYRQLATGDAAGAAAAFAAVLGADEAESTWWMWKYMAADAALGTAFTQIAMNKKSEALASLDRASVLYDQATGMPRPILDRRRRVIAQLRQGLAVKM
ncbi:MAG TPA: serine/threonine-protein kinase [Kofleriaceae bacterium]|nr:serine/threonine-protein kinase [Kofleriaceae bacterium]